VCHDRREEEGKKGCSFKEALVFLIQNKKSIPEAHRDTVIAA
jgi:hypothetical protein